MIFISVQRIMYFLGSGLDSGQRNISLFIIFREPDQDTLPSLIVSKHEKVKKNEQNPAE